MPSFLIIQTASIGDVILTTPLIEKLHHFYPESRIDFLLKKGNESLFKGHPNLHRIIVWDKTQDKYKNFRNVLHKIRDQKYDHVINIQRFASSGILTVLSGAGQTSGFGKNPFSWFFGKRLKHSIRNGNRHETERNLSLINHLTDDSHYPSRLYPAVRDHAAVSQYKTEQYICIAPASLWYTKQYPREKWIEFIKGIEDNYRIYFLGAQDDVRLCDSIITESKYPNALNLAGRLSFLQTAALMQDARMNFVNDSAPLHLASSVNAPVTAIFCSTIPEFGFGPLSDDAVVIQTNRELSCRPCGLHGLKACPEKHFDCAYTIDKEQLLVRL